MDDTTGLENGPRGTQNLNRNYYEIATSTSTYLAAQRKIKMGIDLSETLPAGHKLQWTHWKSLNRLRTGYARAAALMHNWRCGDSPKCTCGELQTMQHLSQYAQLDEKYTVEDIRATKQCSFRYGSV